MKKLILLLVSSFLISCSNQSANLESTPSNIIPTVLLTPTVGSQSTNASPFCPPIRGYYCNESGVHYSTPESGDYLRELTNLSGRIIDENSLPIPGVKVTVKTIHDFDTASFISNKETVTSGDGVYNIKDNPVGTTLEVTAEKDKWKLSKTLTLKSPITDKNINNTDFYKYNGKILFTSFDIIYHIYKIYLINADGTNKRMVSEEYINSKQPVWSPDGSKIAYFTETDDGKATIFTINSDLSNRVKIIGTSGSELSWSADSKKLVFESPHANNGNSQIFTINSDGSDLTPITELSNTNHRPLWSPDGKKISYTFKNNETTDIYTINPDGSDNTDISNNNDGILPGKFYDFPFWSSDSTKLATNDPDGQITITDAYGVHKKIRLKLPSHSGIGPLTWSPDGSKIIYQADISFSQNKGTKSNIYRINSDGTNPILLTDGNFDNNSASWSSDGNKIIFISNMDGVYKLYIINSDGTNQECITPNLPETIINYTSWYDK